MFNLIPREVRFFDYFEQQATHIIQAAALLHEQVHHFSEARARMHAIKDVEHAGDKITHETLDRLARTFITPIDREDIHTLVSRLDDIVDLIDTAVNRMVVYRIARPRPDALELARCLRHATGSSARPCRCCAT